jgi:hypothetical protein
VKAIEGLTSVLGRVFTGMFSLLNRLISILKGQRMKQHLLSRKISADKLLMEANVVPSGVAEVAKLQANEKFVYLRP